MAFSSPWLRKLTVLAWTIGLANSFPASAQEVDPEEVAEATNVAKFVIVLEKGPKRGTALDKVYGYHVERGSLDGLINRYRDKASAAKGADAGPAWMITGLLESLRGQDAASVEAFAKAEQLDAANYLAPYYLGQALVLVGQPDKAAEALERSIGRKPGPADQLEIYQALGRVYQRAQKNDKAIEVWNRLEKQFPNDARVQEQIAVTLLEENEFAAALPRFENLAKTSKDKYRQSQFQMEAAEIKVRLGKSADAIKQFEKLLSQLNPENWLFREVRRRIENIYMRTDDQAGLIAYYEAWTKKNPEDLEAISRLARLLAGLGRGAEAQTWLEKGLKAAPSKKELRHALISQLMYEQKFPEVIAQYEQLDKYEPNNPDTLRDWGRVILKDTKRDEATRRADAAAVWRRLTASKSKDPLIASQVAELFRHAEMTDEALVLYRKAIDLAPEAAQYKEYLGEYFHSLQRKDEALATWRQMSEGKARTAANVARLAEVLAGFGYLSEAVETNAEACKLDPREINLQIKQADLLSQADKHEDALKQLAVIQKLAANDEEREAWIQRELKELQTLEQLKDRIAAMQMELSGLPTAETEKAKLARAEKWFWLARANEAERQLKDAAEAVTKASDLAPQSIPILMSSARILEAQNNLLAAVETNTRLAAIDRRYRTEYLKKVAQLEVQLGRRDKAIQAGRDLLAAAPGNPELYEFFSQLCFQLGQTEEGLQALRRSVRVNPTEPKGLLLLAAALGDQFRTGEAIELYWRAFEKAGNLEDRLSIVPRLAQLYLQTNQLDRLLERLERQRREPNQQREMTICLAQAYQAAGDDGSARQELEKLLTEDTRDTQLLQQLVKLCETDGDLEAAVRFQQQLSKVAPGKETTMRLAQLLMKSGESEEATALMTRIAAEEKDPEQLIKSIDSLLTQKNFDQALAVIERLVRDQPKNWEYLYREGAALASTKPAEAAKRFEAILVLNVKDDEETLIAKNQAKKAQGRMRTPAMQFREMNPFIQRAQYMWQIRQAVGLDQNNRYYGGGFQQQQPFFAPHDFGTARMASIAWLNQFATNAGKEEEFLKQRRDEAEKSTDRRVVVDWYYLATLRQDSKDQYEILKKLSLRPDADIGIKSMYLTTLVSRGGPQSRRVSSIDEEDDKMADFKPLGNDEMEHVLSCYKELDDATSMINYGETFLEVVVAELKRAGRTEEAEKMLQDSIDGAKSPVQIAMVLAGTVQRGDYATAIRLLDRMAELKPESATPTSTSPNAAFNYAQYVSSPQYQSQILGQLMALRAQKKELKDVLVLWDRYLALAVTRYDSTKSAPAAKKRNANANPYGQQGYYQIWRGTNQQGERIDFPSPNDIYDHASLQMLRQAFVVYKDDDIVKDLIEHFQNQLKQDKLTTTTQLFWKLGLGYLHWWNDEKDDALTQLTEVAALLPGNEEMTFELVSLHEKRGDGEQALALIESMPTSDQQTMQRREITALRLSVNSGNIDRARTAAERLFGLRLDSNLQIALARQMHQLAMHEQAEAVLARAGRQAGNKTDILRNLMQQYQSQGKNDVATQIAHQLLRRSPSSGAQAMMGGRGRAVRDESSARQQALLVMKRSGKLPEMIKKVEDQLTHSPKSQRLLETLIEYSTAEGNQKKVAELSAKYAETKGDDPQFQYQLAMQLVRAGKHKESLEHFKAALKKEPRLLRNSYWEMQNAFENADKLDELATLYEEIDLKSFRQNAHELTNLISNMSNRDKTKDRAVILFKKAWKELPDERSQLLSNLNSDVFWKMPEIYDYARQGIIPTESSLRRSGNWPGFGNIQSYNQDGKMTTMLSRFLTIATQSKKLDELAAEVEQARKNLKGWQSGEPLLALIDLRRGRVNEAKATFEKLLPTMKVPNVGHYAHWEIAQELMTHETCVDLAILYLEAAVKNPEVISGNEFPYTPGKALVTLYKQRGRKADARRVIMDAIKGKSRDNYDQQYETYRRLRNVISLGKEIRTLGYPVDAIRLYQESLAKTEDLTTAQRYGGDNIKNELQTGFQAALKDLKPELLPELLMGTPDAADGNAVESVDLVLLVDSRDLDKTSMSSALGKLVVELVKKPDMVSKTKQALSDVRTKRPDDVSALILAAQLSISSKDAENSSAIVKQLVDLIDRTPLDPQPAKGGFTTKQKEAARRQTALWLVARDCLKQESLRPQGIRLAERALEASRRNTDQAYLLAILREWGQIALETGDRKTAEERWTEMLDTVIPKPVDKGKKKDDAKTSLRLRLPGLNDVFNVLTERGGVSHVVLPHRRGQVFKFHFWPHNRALTLTSSRDCNPYCPSIATPKMRFEDQTRHPQIARPLTRWEQLLAPTLVGQFAAPAVSTRAPAPGIPGGSKGGVVTLAQFEQAAQIAKLAADNGLLDLSLKAMTQALHSGPLIVIMQTEDQFNQSGFPAVTAQQLGSEQSPALQAALQKVEQRLTSIETLWRKKGVDDKTVYLLLKQAVLPEGRPQEVFLYPRPLANNPNQQPQSVGLLLVQVAVRANQIEDLKETIALRLKQPLGELPARILATQLALASKDSAAAREQIEALSTRLKLDSLQYSNELACHVAIPAMSLPDLPPAAVTLLERAVEHFTQNTQQGKNASQEEPMRTFRFALARFHFQNGNVAAGKKHLQEYMTFLVPLYARYGGDYGQHRRRLEMLKLAAEFSRAGLQTDTLDCLSQYADLPLSRNYGQEGAGRAGALILGSLAQLPPPEQYELLKTWTLPTSDRLSLRVFAGLIPGDQAPSTFDALRGTVPRGPRNAHLHSTADLLVSAASEADKLDELRKELQPHADKNIENANFMLLLTRIAQGEGIKIAPALSEYLEERRKALPNQGDSQKRPQLLDAVLALSAMRDPVLLELGRQLGLNFFIHCSRVQDHQFMVMMRHDFNGSIIGDGLTAQLDRDQSRPGLKHWTAGATFPARTDSAGAMPMWWIAHEGVISHVCGPDLSNLYFKYPLTGTFEVSCEGWLGSWAEANVGFGGLAFQTLNLGNDVTIFPIGNRGDIIHKPDPLENRDHFNRLSVKVDPENIRHYVNGYLIHTEPNTAATSPWYFLHCGRAWQTCYRNIQIKGDPQIPREVQMSQGDTLLGWCTDFYGETQPPHSAAQPASGEAATSQPDTDWNARDGIIHGRFLPSTGFGKSPVQQSRLYYSRPLLDGERLRYEFWYEAGAGGCHVHPAFDRLALLLDPEGVKLHWMTDGAGPEDAYSGLVPENVGIDKSIQRGKLLLKDQSWNAVEIELKDGVATIALNGSIVAARPLEPENSRLFGFYHDKNFTSAKVRNVVLTGNWPKTLSPELLADLTAPAGNRTDAERRKLGVIIEEKFYATDLDGILRQTRALPPKQRYEALKNWVLPNEDHGTVRVYADTAPADPLPVTPIVIARVEILDAAPAKQKLLAGSQAEHRQRTGGELIAPVLDLVAVARQLGKLDELADQVRKIPESPEQVKRSRLAILALIAIAANDFKQAEATLKEMTVPREKGLPDALSLVERWPEFIAASEASRVPELRNASIAILELMTDSVNRKGIGTPWDSKVRSARQQALVQRDRKIDLPTASSVSPKGQWTQATQLRASTRANGLVPRWHFQGAESLHIGGEGSDYLYFQSPLRGTFTVEGELATFGWREPLMMYAAQFACPQYSLDCATIGNLYTQWAGPKFAAKIQLPGDWYRFKMEVTPDKVAYYANEQWIHENLLTDNSDPWLAIHSMAQYATATRSLRISGTPEIPVELSLSNRDDLQGWWAGMYEDPMSDSDPAWKKMGIEIVGQKYASWDGRSRESLLQYHRPVLEDGQISYEFLHGPEMHVHPALDRMVLLLADEGVKVHWLTDAQYERGGLAPDNVTVEKEHRRGPAALPLKANDWNAVVMKLQGDALNRDAERRATVTLTLNGELIYERPVDPTNLRTFGLFRCETEVRVRNVVYKGNWPKKLPTIKEQELARDDMELVTFKDGELPATYSWNFQGRQPLHLDNSKEFPTTRRTPVEGGIKVVREPNSDPTSDAAGFQWAGVEVGGDFEITLGYRDFVSSTKSTTNKVPRVEIILALGGGFSSPQHCNTLALTHSRMLDGSMRLISYLSDRRNPPVEDWQAWEHPLAATAGRIRIVRRGAMVYYLQCKPDSDEWKLYEQRPVATVDVKDILFGLRSEDLVSNASVVFTEFSVRAKQLNYVPRFADEDLPGKLAWNFKGNQPQGLQALGTEEPNTFEAVPVGIKINRPEDPDQKAGPVGYKWQGKLSGDFEVTLACRDFDSATDKTDWQAPRLEIHIPIGAPTHYANSAVIAIRRHPDDQTLATGIGEPQPDGQRVWRTTERKTGRTGGRLRLVRVGATIHALIASSGSDDFVPVASNFAGTDDITSMTFAVRSESQKSRASFTLTELSIRAQKLDSDSIPATDAIVGPAPFRAKDLPAKASWNFQGTQPRFLVDWGPRKMNSAAPVPDGIKVIRRPKVDNSEQVIGYMFDGTLHGDFEITLDYRDFESVPVATDWRAPRVDISAGGHSIVDPTQSLHTMGIAHRRSVNGDLRIIATQGDKGADGKVNYKTDDRHTARDSGRLRMVRQGSNMFYQAAALGTEKWVNIKIQEIDPGPVKNVSFGVRAEDLEGSGEAVLTNVTIRAREIVVK